MPAYTLMSAFIGLQAPLPQGWRLEFTVGVEEPAQLYVVHAQRRSERRDPGDAAADVLL
jgi:hypothetical protein